MYIRKPNYGSGTIEWNPDDDELGRKATQNVTNETDLPVEVDRETSQKIRQEYAALHVEKYGQDSQFSNQ